MSAAPKPMPLRAQVLALDARDLTVRWTYVTKPFSVRHGWR